VTDDGSSRSSGADDRSTRDGSVTGDPYAGRNPQDVERLARFDQIWRLPIILGAILPIALVGSTHEVFSDIISVLAWIVFVIDLVVHMRLIAGYLRTKRGIVDLVIVILTAPWFLIPGLGGTAFFTLARVGRLVRLVAVGPARRLFARLGRVFIVATTVVFVCSTIAYRAEHATNAGYATFGDALWWGIVTLTTVGYGDIVPKTTAGRFAGVLIMFTGVAVLGLLAGNLASFMRLEPSEADESDESTPDDGARLTQLIDELRDQVDRVAAAVEEQRRSGGS
jgi:voltage-gated potassium channel